MRKFIELLTNYWFSYLFTCIVLVAVFSTKVDIVDALAGAFFYALFFAVVPVFIAEFLDGLLPPKMLHHDRSFHSSFNQQDFLASQRKRKLP